MFDSKPVSLILDLDGVLITTPNWKPDIISEDGYSKFDENCVKNLNTLLSKINIEIFLISTRRLKKSLKEFNLLFRNRGISQEIKSFIPDYPDCKSRFDELNRFLNENENMNYLIIDDDKSLNALEYKKKERLILTDYNQGFSTEKLNEALSKVNK